MYYTPRARLAKGRSWSRNPSVGEPALRVGQYPLGMVSNAHCQLRDQNKIIKLSRETIPATKCFPKVSRVQGFRIICEWHHYGWVQLNSREPSNNGCYWIRVDTAPTLDAYNFRLNQSRACIIGHTSPFHQESWEMWLLWYSTWAPFSIFQGAMVWGLPSENRNPLQ